MSTNLCDIPDDLLIEIAKIHPLKEIWYLFGVNKKLATFANNDQFWKIKYNESKKSDSITNKPTDISWRKFYKEYNSLIMIRPMVEKTYQGKAIEITWKPTVISHSINCRKISVNKYHILFIDNNADVCMIGNYPRMYDEFTPDEVIPTTLLEPCNIYSHSKIMKPDNTSLKVKDIYVDEKYSLFIDEHDNCWYLNYTDEQFIPTFVKVKQVGCGSEGPIAITVDNQSIDLKMFLPDMGLKRYNGQSQSIIYHPKPVRIIGRYIIADEDGIIDINDFNKYIVREKNIKYGSGFYTNLLAYSYGFIIDQYDTVVMVPRYSNSNYYLVDKQRNFIKGKKIVEGIHGLYILDNNGKLWILGLKGHNDSNNSFMFINKYIHRYRIEIIWSKLYSCEINVVRVDQFGSELKNIVDIECYNDELFVLCQHYDAKTLDKL